jgi:glycosyltransferase involved in cell wall biosynthesis
LVFPSQTETFGNVVLEAQASGVPVIGVAGTAVSATVRDGDNGRLIGHPRPDCLADAMVELASDPGTRARMGRTARQHAGSHSWHAVFDLQFSVYREVRGGLARPRTESGSVLPGFVVEQVRQGADG